MRMLIEQKGVSATATFLRGSAKRLRNPRAALVDVGEELITDHAQRLSRGVDVHDKPFKKSRRAAAGGGQTLFQTGAMASSTDFKASSNALDFYSTDPRARVHNEGLTITPKKGKFLTIPLRATAEESRQRFMGLTLRGGKSRTGARIRHYKGVFFRWSRGRLFAMQRVGDGEGSRGKLRALFLLVRSQKMVKREWFGVTRRVNNYAETQLMNLLLSEKGGNG